MDKTFYTEENPIRFPYTAKYEPTETKLVVYYNIDDISSPTLIFTNYDNVDCGILSAEIDGEEIVDGFPSGPVEYQFNAAGQHIIKYKLNNSKCIGKNAPLFYNVKTAERAIIPNTVITIGSNAFNSSSFSQVVIPETVCSIGESAFNGCKKLTTIVVPKYVKNIGNYCFGGCEMLTTAKIYPKAPSIGTQIFGGCSSLTYLEWNCYYVPNALCANLSTLKQVILTDSVQYINNQAFFGCAGLTSIKLGNNICDIYDSAFEGCISLKQITIPDSVSGIRNRAFIGCESLTHLIIGHGVNHIDNNAFYGCSNLMNIISLSNYGPACLDYSFSNTKENGVLTIPKNNINYDQLTGKLPRSWTVVEQ